MSITADDFDVLFGPAYKGIPLSVTTATMAIQRAYTVRRSVTALTVKKSKTTVIYGILTRKSR